MTIIFDFNSAPPLPFSGSYRETSTFIHRIKNTHMYLWLTDMQWGRGCQTGYPKTPAPSGLPLHLQEKGNFTLKTIGKGREVGGISRVVPFLSFWASRGRHNIAFEIGYNVLFFVLLHLRFENVFYDIAQASLEFLILLTQVLECWICMHIIFIIKIIIILI